MPRFYYGNEDDEAINKFTSNLTAAVKMDIYVSYDFKHYLPIHSLWKIARKGQLIEIILHKFRSVNLIPFLILCKYNKKLSKV